jgi:muramidase (phage lysozyme)
VTTAPAPEPQQPVSAAQFGILDQQQPQTTTQQTTQTSSSVNTQGLGILDFISKGEGGYNSSNRGTRNKKIVGSTSNTVINGKPLTESTIGEIMQAQRDGLFAVGRYQMIPTTFKVVVDQLGLTDDQVFTPELQDQMGLQLLLGDKRPKLAAYLRGEDVDVNTAMLEFAKEWASVPDPSTGKSYYAGTGNKASHSVSETRAILEATRAQITGQQ